MMAFEPVAFLDLAAGHAEVRDELDAIWHRSIDTSGFIGGNAVASFEQQFANYCDTTYCVGVANGTDALELILAGLEIGHGDHVIVPANTFVATAEAVVRVGATPVFCDVDPATLLMSVDDVDAVRTPSTRAVLAVHLYGQCVDMKGLQSYCERHDLMLIEDAAQAHGASSHGQRAGSMGRAAGFSFYPGKNLGALGDGGAVTTNDGELAARIRTLANHGRADGHHDHGVVGRNSRLDALQAAALEVKLARLERWNARRRERWQRYCDNLAGVHGVTPLTIRSDVVAVHHLAVVQVSMRDEVRSHLAAAGIATGVHYPTPCHRQPAFAMFGGQNLANVEQAAQRIISLPMYPQLPLSDVDRVCEVLCDIARS